jgi:hypothetical protein
MLLLNLLLPVLNPAPPLGTLIGLNTCFMSTAALLYAPGPGVAPFFAAVAAAIAGLLRCDSLPKVAVW